MEKFFNTAGPVRAENNYMIDPLNRINKDEIMTLVDKWRYFILHAPRQTGKTSSLFALQDYINKQGHYKCLYVNVEPAQAARSKVEEGIKAIIVELASSASLYLKEEYFFDHLNTFISYGGYTALKTALSRWCQESDKPVILLMDEIDSLVGDTLISVLRQLRAGYAERPHSFPQSIILCGVRDVRDYRIFSDRDQQIITGGSAFNIKAKSLTVGDFTQEEIRTLYEEHTKETGQKFEEGVFDLAWNYTRGQPWLVNALANEVCYENVVGRDRNKPITAQMFEGAKQALIARRDTHIDQLADKLKEDRVRRVIEPILKVSNAIDDVSEDDIQYCEDLGLIKRVGSLEIANEIYREVIPRSLSYATQRTIYQEPQWYVDKDGTLNMMKLLTNFQQFFREQSESWLSRFKYEEAGPQLLLQAFLQRILNGGGLIDREYGLGRKRTDLYIRWPIIKDRFKEEGKEHPFPLTYNPDDLQRIVIELKLKHNYSLETVIDEGLKQT
ncbi:MAG: AAA-like domain-containing protein, partial [Thermotogota bacterium]|nr:AAA-like domain-containing protein [Thermotogota bacterium]